MLDLDYLSRYLFIQVCWTFIPKSVTAILIYIYYSLRYKDRHAQQPQKGSEAYANDFRKIYSLVFITYLLYSVSSEVYKQKPSYYTDLKISRRKCEINLKSRYRTILHELHPDKTTDPNPELFLKLKTRYEVLNNKATRDAYDTFGPKILQHASKIHTDLDKRDASTFWRTCMDAMQFDLLAYYGGALLTVFLSCFVNGNFSTLFWRMMCMLGFFFTEASFYVIEKPLSKIFLDPFLGFLPIHQQINVLRCLALNLSVLFDQIGKAFQSTDGEDHLNLIERCLKVIHSETLQLSEKFLPIDPDPDD